MKRPWLLAAVVVLVISNAWVLTQIAINRSGTPDSDDGPRSGLLWQREGG